jgi:alpha-ribazole phosphatase/probable phosphoglycerate mutase
MKEEKTTELILIRHGETDYNRENRFLGHTDIGINETGREQAERLKEILSEEDIGEVYCSDLKRCRETAEIIDFGKEIEFSENLREMNFGEWEGKKWKEVLAAGKDEFASWREDWINRPVPGGESFRDMSGNVISEIERIKNGSGKIAVVTHGGCIRTVIGHYLMNSLEKSWHFQVDNGTICRISFSDNYVILKSLNEK